MNDMAHALDHLRPLEKAARLYCAKAGFDPDAVAHAPHPTIVSTVICRPQWTFAAEKLLDLSMQLTSLREAAADSVGAAPGKH